MPCEGLAGDLISVQYSSVKNKPPCETLPSVACYVQLRMYDPRDSRSVVRSTCLFYPVVYVTKKRGIKHELPRVHRHFSRKDPLEEL